MIQEKLKELMKPIMAEVYEEGYNKGSEDTSRRMHEMLQYGVAKGYADALANHGIVELDDIEGINEYLGVLVEERVRELGGAE